MGIKCRGREVVGSREPRITRPWDKFDLWLRDDEFYNFIFYVMTRKI